MKPDVYFLMTDNETATRPDYLHESANFVRPITPPYFHQQVRARRGSIYDQPFRHYSDEMQVPVSHTSSTNQQQNELFSATERNFFMNQMGNKKLRPKQTVQRQLLDNTFDILAIAATCLIFGLIYGLAKPFHRGFFCDDSTIQYPFRSDTVPMWLLAIYGGLAPILIFLIVEIWVVRPFSCGQQVNQTNLKQRRIDYLKAIIQTVILFGLGAAVCFFITEVGKRTIGRLRPYFLTICNPVWANIQCSKTVTTLSGSVSISQYVTEFTCNTTATASDLQEARLSFPSGHASYSTYAFVFLFVYFEARLVCPNMKFLRPFLQCLCIAIAFFTCLSRVTDNKHHATDVIGGAILGFAIAVFTAVRVGTYLWSLSVYCETDEETAKDNLPIDERVPVPGINTQRDGAMTTRSSNLPTRQPSASKVPRIVPSSNVHDNIV